MQSISKCRESTKTHSQDGQDDEDGEEGRSGPGHEEDDEEDEHEEEVSVLSSYHRVASDVLHLSRARARGGGASSQSTWVTPRLIRTDQRRRDEPGRLHDGVRVFVWPEGS